MEQKRDYGLDLLKIVFCIMVICIHTPWTYGMIFYYPLRTLWAIALPGFFAISGYFLVILESDTKKVYTKILPRYIVVFCFWAMIHWLVGWIPEHGSLVGFHHFVAENAECWHLWYLKCLIELLLFYPLLKAIVEKKSLFIMYTIYWCIFVGARFVFTYTFGINHIYWRVLQIPLVQVNEFVGGTAFAYYPELVMGPMLIGGMFIQFVKKNINESKWTIRYVAMIAVGVLIAILLGVYRSYENPGFEPIGPVEPANGFLLLSACGLIGIALSLYRYSERGARIIECISSLTLGVYVSHPLVTSWTKQWYDKMGRPYDVLLYVINIVISFVIIALLKLILPKAIRKWIM